MKRHGCTDCHLIEPVAGQWRGGLCPSCTEIRRLAAERAPVPAAEPKPAKDPALDATVARLQDYLARIADQYPDVWKNVDKMRAERGRRLPQWPSWCFMPLSGAFAIASDFSDDGQVAPEKYVDVGVIGCLAAWRPTQGIYRFDETVRQAVWDTPLDGEIPTEILHALPEWCVYVETPGAIYLDAPSPGFFAFLEQDTHDTREELRIVVDLDSGGLSVAVPVHLDRGGLLAGVESALAEAARQIDQHGIPTTDEGRRIMSLSRPMLADALAPRVNLLLYLCSTNAEMRERKTGKLRPRKPLLTKTKDGMRMFPAEKPAAWEVAYRLGAAIRHAQEIERTKPGDGTHASPRAHVRRAHWHSFWTGPKAKISTGETERKLILRWLPPIAVNVDEDLQPVPTVHEVKA